MAIQQRQQDKVNRAQKLAPSTKNEWVSNYIVAIGRKLNPINEKELIACTCRLRIDYLKFNQRKTITALGKTWYNTYTQLLIIHKLYKFECISREYLMNGVRCFIWRLMCTMINYKC